MSNRRNFFRDALGWGVGLAVVPKLDSAEVPPPAVQTPDVPNLPHTMENGMKVFHLIANPSHEKSHLSRQSPRGDTTAQPPGQPSRSHKATVCGSLLRTGSPNRPASVGMASKFRSKPTVHRTSANNRFRLAANSCTSSNCTRLERSFITPMERCRKWRE